MNKIEQKLLQNFPRHQDYLKQQLHDDPEYAQMWLDSLLEDYSESKDINDLIDVIPIKIDEKDRLAKAIINRYNFIKAI